MITIRPSHERGHADHGWLDARHSFSFGQYYAPEHMGFRSLRVLNEDRVRGGRGFAEHPHDNMEIITYVLDGALRHRDSAGHESTIHPGMVQVMSAGTGIRHSEANDSAEHPVHLLQIWIEPDQRGHMPAYAERRFETDVDHRLQLLVSGDGRDDSLRIHQDADVFRVSLEAGERAQHSLGDDRGVWVQVTSGELDVGEVSLQAGDGAIVERESEVAMHTHTGVEALLFDLP
jgi:redox-sensitive bicupin YhaK (pirin superfamily)